MVDSAEQTDGGGPASLSPGRRFLEIALILLVCFVIGGDPPPHDNEAHYLSRLKHHFDPQWCARDLFLESADAQLAFIWTFGWLTKWFSLPAVAWMGRFVAWAGLAWAWQRLSWRLLPRPWISVLTAALFLGFNMTAHLAGEWIVGGVEGKCFAYVFVLVALREMLDDRWGRVALALGAAIAFHPLVGGWSALIVGMTWAIEHRRSLPGAILALFRSPGFISCICGGAFLALVGIVPAIALTWGQPTAIVAEASRIYVFDRLPHHLALLRMPGNEVFARFMRHGVLLIFAYILWKILLDQTPANGRNSTGLRRIVWFAIGAAILAACGVAIEILFWNDLPAAARFQRYYWYRLTDFAGPAAASLVVMALVVRGWQLRRAWAIWGMAAIVLAIAWSYLGNARERWEAIAAPADAKWADIMAWEDVCRWVSENTPSDALFLTPRANLTFKWHAGRAEAVTRKDIPQDAASIVAWNERMRDIYYRGPHNEPLDEPTSSVSSLGTERVLELAERYGFDYVVTEWRRPLALPQVYPNVAEANHEFVVYRIPPGGRASRRNPVNE